MFAVCLVSKIDVIPATHNTMISQGNIDRTLRLSNFSDTKCVVTDTNMLLKIQSYPVIWLLSHSYAKTCAALYCHLITT